MKKNTPKGPPNSYSGLLEEDLRDFSFISSSSFFTSNKASFSSFTKFLVTDLVRRVGVVVSCSTWLDLVCLTCEVLPEVSSAFFSSFTFLVSISTSSVFCFLGRPGDRPRRGLSLVDRFLGVLFFLAGERDRDLFRAGDLLLPLLAGEEDRERK